ncbi:MAG: lysylphosphatidylglycerol synthase domain-containing protein [Cellulomonadaceae bacterium]
MTAPEPEPGAGRAEEGGARRETGSAASARRRRLLGILGRVLLWALVVVLLWNGLRVLRRIDWSAVGAALGQLAWWQVLALAAVLAVRTAFRSAPLALFVQGLGLRRAIGNDLVGDLVATVTPAPADVVARGALFRSWGIDPGRGIAGLVLNSVLYYVVRLAAPIAGAVVMLWTIGETIALGTAALLSGIASALLVAGLVVGAHSPRSAAGLGRFLGRTVHRFRPSGPGPDEVAAKALEFYDNVAGRWRKHWASALGSLALQVLVESVLLVLALRFVGVTPPEAPTFVVIAAFLSVYMLMATPMQGLGVFDAAVVALIVDRTTASAAQLVAGLIIWRVCVQLVPLVAALAPLLTWRRRRTLSA